MQFFTYVGVDVDLDVQVTATVVGRSIVQSHVELHTDASLVDENVRLAHDRTSDNWVFQINVDGDELGIGCVVAAICSVKCDYC
jgi:hypothetical protein